MDSQTQPFDSRQYWNERLSAHADKEGVGSSDTPPFLADLMYNARMRQVERVLRRLKLKNLKEKSILDVGSGTGIWLEFWRRHGANRVAGLEFSDPGVRMLRAKFPDALIVQADLRAPHFSMPNDTKFDVVSAFEVLLHVVTPEEFDHSIANLASWCKPGGWLVISDPITFGNGYVPPRQQVSYMTVRPMAELRHALPAHGFEILSAGPTTVLLNAPLEGANKAIYKMSRIWWRVWITAARKSSRSPRLAWTHSKWLISVISAALLGLDAIACRLWPRSRAPTSKLIVARKVS
ncbi:MAG TPA: class I SAM-dependent methyltransferase [Ktedonobacterales bacterium]